MYVWKILESYFQDQKVNPLVAHHIESYNYFINFGAQEIIDSEPPIILPNYSVRFGQISFTKPQLVEENRKIIDIYPSEARTKDINYDTQINCDIIEEFISENGEKAQRFFPRINIGKIPVMLKSCLCNLSSLTPEEQVKQGECPNDFGGYFIVKGNERVLVSQIRNVYNQIIVMKQKNLKKYKYVAETRIMAPETRHSILLQCMLGLDNRSLYFSLPFVKEPVPVGVVFKALGYISDEEIINFIGLYRSDTNKYIKYILRDSYFCQTQKDALEHIGKYALHVISEDREKEYAFQVIENETLLHLGIGTSKKEQAYYFGHMVRKLLLTVVKARGEDDRDSYSNKRVEVAGLLLSDLFSNIFKKYIVAIKKELEKKKQKPDILSILLKTKTITKGFNQCFATGNWSVQKNALYVRSGVSQVLDRMTYASTVSHLRRVIIPTDKERKNTELRQLHPTQFGFICPCECFDPNTPILMWNGDTKLAKDIKIGDCLISDKGTKTFVKSTCSGFNMMYEIKPKKKNFMNHITTDNHILTLKSNEHKVIRKHKEKFETIIFDKNKIKYKWKSFNDEQDAKDYLDTIDDDNIIDITIENYLKLPKTMQNSLKLFKCSNIDWPEQKVDIDPYILGMWLGDGFSSGYAFASADQELIDIWIEWCEKNELRVEHCNRYAYSIKSIHKGKNKNKFIHLLNDYRLINNKHIPKEYLINSRESRLKLLAGIIDTDGNVRANGHEIRICQGPKNTRIIYDTLLLSRSLGFSSTISTGKSSWILHGEKKYSTYTELTITGNNIYEIPTVLLRKKLSPPNNKGHAIRCESSLKSSFELIKKEIGPFVGFQLDGNGRFLLQDATVSHNTPEGQRVGIVLNFAMMTKITRKIPSVLIRRLLEKKSKTILFIQNIDEKEFTKYVPVFLNYVPIGFTQNTESTLQELAKMKRIGLLDKEISIIFDKADNEIKILCDEGRFCRPFFTLKNNELLVKPAEKYNWNKMLEKEIIKYVDASEIEQSVIAMTSDKLKEQKCDYCEIHPSLILGVIAGAIPFSDHSQSPRNCYQSNMGKQALGVPILSYNIRSDTLLHILHYPQRRLVETALSRLIGYSKMPAGINVMVAIMCYSGYNQEDSVMVNLSAIQRGLFAITSYHTIDCSEKKRDTYSYEEICLPPTDSDSSIKEGSPGYFKRKNANYNLLDENGIVRPREYGNYGNATRVMKGDVIIGKVITTGTKNGEETRHDESVIIGLGEEGVIDRVITTIKPDGHKLVKVIIRNMRQPVLGDKIASSEAQKATIGMVYRQEDMPFTSKGMVPDIIINPCCIPSRMTINQLIETVMGKIVCITGEYGDATPFTENSTNVANRIVNDIEQNIINYGFESHGWETMRNGMTGELIESKIFVGPTYYQRLKHMVDDKMHARAKGQVTMLTRQPLEGRANYGGLKTGEMERDAFISHGLARILKERLFDVSDPFQIPICNKCKIITNKTNSCQICKSNNITICNFPYASKLLETELRSLMLDLSIETD